MIFSEHGSGGHCKNASGGLVSKSSLSSPITAFGERAGEELSVTVRAQPLTKRTDATQTQKKGKRVKE
jgi:hypothetical protein